MLARVGFSETRPWSQEVNILTILTKWIYCMNSPTHIRQASRPILSLYKYVIHKRKFGMIGRRVWVGKRILSRLMCVNM